MIKTLGAQAFTAAMDSAAVFGHDMQRLAGSNDKGRDAICTHCRGTICEFVAEGEETRVQADEELEGQCPVGWGIQ